MQTWELIKTFQAGGLYKELQPKDILNGVWYVEE